MHTKYLKTCLDTTPEIFIQNNLIINSEALNVSQVNQHHMRQAKAFSAHTDEMAKEFCFSFLNQTY